MQLSFIDIAVSRRPSGQLLKWVGNKFKYANKIVSFFPEEYNKFIEPFVGTGAIIATIAPQNGFAGDTLKPLIDMWELLQNNPLQIISYYEKLINKYYNKPKKTYYEVINGYNNKPNPLDLIVISRTCYGGVIRFTKEGTISTPIGPHKPIAPQLFAKRAKEWRERIKNVSFQKQSFEETMRLASYGDLIYCDPPYLDSQKILYGAQNFSFEKLINAIIKCKNLGAKVALSIDGKKKSGKKNINLSIPKNLFEREIFLDCGSSMLRRFQNGGKVMIDEDVHDRLLLTW